MTERTGVHAPARGAQGVSEHLVEHGHDERVSARRVLLPGIVFALALAYILVGLVVRQLVRGADYDDRFRVQSSRIIQVPAPRGFIFDRNGKLIVGNRPRFSIVADLSALQEEFRIEYLRRFREARAKRNAAPKPYKLNIPAIRNEAHVAVLRRYLEQVKRVLDGRHETVDPVAVKRHLESKRALDLPLISDIAPEEVARFVENFPEEYPLRLYVDSVRNYPYGDSAAHVLGFLSNSDDLGEDTDEDPDVSELGIRRVKYTGKTGASGLERACNDSLQGKPGSQEWMVNPKGQLYRRMSETKSEQGSHITCSLDIDIQQAAEKALGVLKNDAGEPLKGAAIAIDIPTGEVLALASYPRFDPNKFADRVSADYYRELQATGGEFNRATKGTYPPGSTFKIITAIAGLRSGLLDPDELLECGYNFDIGGRLWPEHDGLSFGQVDLEKMLRVSCNVYCYQLGLRLGIDPIAREARRFGMDDKGLLEIATAPKRNLIVPDAAWKRAHGYSGWSSGDTANTAIGQGFILTTPLHMAQMIASVAADRTRTGVTLIRHAPKRDLNPAPLGLTPYQRKRLIDGLVSCIEGGTGKSVKYPKNGPALPLNIAGKTGTAEFKKDGHPVNLAWFVGFAPVENPRIAVAVMLEGEKGARSLHGGASAGPVAHAMFARWLDSLKKPAEEPGAP